LKAEGEFAQAVDYLESGISAMSHLVAKHDVITMLADISVEHDNLELIEKYAHQAEELANRYDHRLYQAISHRALGAANRLKNEYKQAENRLTKALEIFKELDCTWQLGRTYYEFGQLAIAQDEAAEAKKHFGKAIEHFEEMGAKPDLERTQAALKSIDT
jgi:tetratricopeptide (TPR) repeat protein